MAPWIWAAITASSVVFGQLQNFGTDPGEAKRGDKMISQSERMIAQNEKMLKQSRIAIRLAILALVISAIGCAISLIAVFLRH